MVLLAEVCSLRSRLLVQGKYLHSRRICQGHLSGQSDSIQLERQKQYLQPKGAAVRLVATPLVRCLS